MHLPFVRLELVCMKENLPANAARICRKTSQAITPGTAKASKHKKMLLS